MIFQEDKNFDIDCCCGENEMYAWINYNYNYGGTKKYWKNEGYQARKATLIIEIE